MPSSDDIVKIIICLWFSFALLVGLSHFFDKFLVFSRNITPSIQDVFITYIDKLIEHNENLDTPLYLPLI